MLEAVFGGGEPEPTPIPAVETTPDALHTVLSNARRRHVIELVAERGAQTLNELTDSVAEREFGVDAPRRKRKSVYTCLYQSHLDALDDVGAIEYDGRNDVVPTGETDAWAAAVTLGADICGGGR